MAAVRSLDVGGLGSADGGDNRPGIAREAIVGDQDVGGRADLREHGVDALAIFFTAVVGRDGGGRAGIRQDPGGLIGRAGPNRFFRPRISVRRTRRADTGCAPSIPVIDAAR